MARPGVSLLSDFGMRIEDISRLVGHRNTVVTETVYRQKIQQGVQRMDSLFSGSVGHSAPHKKIRKEV
ncbi:hypothetical protein [Nonomuraea sediminis]|uniref:hypothetical protein n=1 Tax=Nonomuraea sediminis TaxID=2835864 RepID=UPI001BDC7478|nr:hypothetical protein [Nonomuraea sediminis]